MKNYKKTLLASYLAFITQAIVANFTPLLFIKFHKDYNIPLGTIALISSVFYLAQLIVDVFCAKFIDLIGYRKSIIMSEVFSAIGLIGLAILPDLFTKPFIVIMICVALYAVGSGLIEVLASPIVEACPFDNKESVMSLLHSFYCWGALGVVLISSLFFTIFGIDNWKWIACIWALVPLYNIYNFAICPIEQLVEEGQGLGTRKLLRLPLFWLSIVLMICAGASEISMAQWASAYAEAALHLSKTVSDLFGPCMFAVTMGISRVFYGKYGEKMDLKKYMLGSGILCLICYIFASLSMNPIVGLLGCVVCGASVGIMWPGTISISSKNIPTGGTALFAFLAMAGDLGGTIGPSIVGRIAQANGDAIQIGLRAGSIFPIILIVCIILINNMEKKNKKEVENV